jgi:hypothetical protein
VRLARRGQAGLLQQLAEKSQLLAYAFGLSQRTEVLLGQEFPGLGRVSAEDELEDGMRKFEHVEHLVETDTRDAKRCGDPALRQFGVADEEYHTNAAEIKLRVAFARAVSRSVFSARQLGGGGR